MSPQLRLLNAPLLLTSLLFLGLGCASEPPTPPGGDVGPPDASLRHDGEAPDTGVDATLADATLADATLMDAPMPDGSDCVPSPERCDGVDNDCDPSTADDADEPCPGAPRASGVCEGAAGCTLSCLMGYADCNADLSSGSSDGCEVDTVTDPAHCGACGRVCRDGESCVAGSCEAEAVLVDGIIGAGEWSTAVSATNTVATTWGAGLNELRRVLARADADNLYIAVDGVVESTNAILVYVDTAPSGGVCDLFSLTDGSGAVDDALSAGLRTPPSFCPDYAWATREMSRVAMGDDDLMGWRDIVRTPSDFGWFSADMAPSACSANACETRFPITSLGLPFR